MMKSLETWHLQELSQIMMMASSTTTGNLYISAIVAKSTEQESEYIKQKGFDDQYYKDMIIEYLKQQKKAKKKDIKNLLWDKLPEGLTDGQKESKIKNMLHAFANEELIMADSDNKRLANWILK